MVKLGLWCTSTDKEYMPLFLYQLDKEKIDYEIIPAKRWVLRGGNCWAERTRDLHNWAKTQKGLIMFPDAWDHVFLGTRELMEEKIRSFESDLVWAAEKVCWPNEEKANEFPITGTAYRFPNGGAMMGDAAIFADLFDPDRIPGFGQANYDSTSCFHPKGNQTWMDQVYFQDLYLKGWGVLDYDCRLFQTLVDCKQGDFAREGNLIKNRHTGGTPLFWHANGKSKYPECLMELLEETL